MFLFSIPQSVAQKIDRARRNFLWDSHDDMKKFLVGWDRNCCPLDQGGLGVLRLKEMNKACLAKWLWRFGEEKGALWRDVIIATYGVHPYGWFSIPGRGPLGLGVWRGISNLFVWF